jgi:uncharacterized protein
MFKRWFWNLILFAINVFGFILLSWIIAGFVMSQVDKPKSAEEEITVREVFDYKIAMACFSDNCIEVEIADTKEKQRQGLMFRNEVSSNSGMLFLFENEGVHSFWMKNVDVSLDIIFLDSSFKVVHIANAVLCSDECVLYEYNSKYVIEVKEGFARDNNINVGDYVRIDLKNLR